jgi:hypothetical protein
MAHFCFISILPLLTILGGMVGAQPAPTPSGGLGGNVNYFYYSSGQTINSLQATVEFDMDLIIGDTQDGLSFQLNCFSPYHTVSYQQFAWVFDSRHIGSVVETWTLNRFGVPIEVIAQEDVFTNSTGKIPAGSVLSMQLLFDDQNNVNGPAFNGTIGGIKGISTITFDNAFLSSPAQPFAPIVVFTFDVVGDGKTTKLKQGSGTITYQSNTNHFARLITTQDRYLQKGVGKVEIPCMELLIVLPFNRLRRHGGLRID